ncbi:hypothetical protein JEQ12_002528 [Ovis aries]|uniref:EF-hand domain-containing protein n=1 Tax=Ovis aries TaxID=9940 RepID=A0A836CYZ0_SHEEP|nr:hypothetical protein JEQ12_002528 [Ovis aries]
MEQISSTLRPVQDGEQEEPEVPTMGGGVRACERLAHPRHTGSFSTFFQYMQKFQASGQLGSIISKAFQTLDKDQSSFIE